METRLPGFPGRPALTVGQQRYDPQIAKWLEVMLHGAVTIAQLVHVSEHVVDSCIVYATEAAARLFGVTHPTELVGQFISKVHHPDDALAASHSDSVTGSFVRTKSPSASGWFSKGVRPLDESPHGV